MQNYFYNVKELEKAGIKYILSIGKRQPMHIGHKRSLERIIALKEMKLIYVIGSSNTGKDPLFDPVVNPLTIDQQIEQFKQVFINQEAIFLPILDVADMGRWGPSIIDALNKIDIDPKKCAIHFIGKPEDKLMVESKFSLVDGKEVRLLPGQWLIEALSYYNLAIWFDQEMLVDLSISARKFRQLDLENLTLEQQNLLAAPDYLKNIAQEARKNNPELLAEPITLYDLSLKRKKLEQ